MKLDEAAEISGMKQSEITGLEDAPAGVLIHVFDGSTLIWVDPKNPDDEGKSGLMYLTAPHDPYFGALPVYTQPVTKADVDDEVEAQAVKDEVAAVQEKAPGGKA